MPVMSLLVIEHTHVVHNYQTQTTSGVFDIFQVLKICQFNGGQHKKKLKNGALRKTLQKGSSNEIICFAYEEVLWCAMCVFFF
jgi:hypothetical protein